MIRGVNKRNPDDVRTFVATESKHRVGEVIKNLEDGEQFVAGEGHGAETIIRELGEEFWFLEGGSSRNVCESICRPMIEDAGMTLGGQEFKGTADKTLFRQFWRP